MKRRGVPRLVEDILELFFEQHGYELYDIAFTKEHGRRFLRVSADKPNGGFDISDCENISRFLSNRLDEMDPIKENYFLEVSSPGAERVFKHESDYIRFQGSRVNVTLNQMIDGQKLITGKLIEKKGDVLYLYDEATDEDVEISMDLVARVKNILEV